MQNEQLFLFGVSLGLSLEPSQFLPVSPPYHSKCCQHPLAPKPGVCNTRYLPQIFMLAMSSVCPLNPALHGCKPDGIYSQVRAATGIFSIWNCQILEPHPSRPTLPAALGWSTCQLLLLQCFTDKGHRVRILKRFPGYWFPLSFTSPSLHSVLLKSPLSIPGAQHNGLREAEQRVKWSCSPCGVETNDSPQLIKWQKTILCSQLSKAFLHFSKMSHRVASPASTTSKRALGTQLFPLVCFYLSERWGGE